MEIVFPRYQRQVVQRIVCQWTNAMIAADLGMSEGSVKQYVRRIIRKTGREAPPIRGSGRRELAALVRPGPEETSDGPSVEESVAAFLRSMTNRNEESK